MVVLDMSPENEFAMSAEPAFTRFDFNGSNKGFKTGIKLFDVTAFG